MIPVNTNIYHKPEMFEITATDGFKVSVSLFTNKNSKITCVDLNPNESSLGNIGHMGYFLPQTQPLWDEVPQCFKKIQ